MINNHYWTTRDGRKIPTSDMKDSHAMNSAKMLQRKTGFRSKTEKETWQEKRNGFLIVDVPII